MLSGWFKDLTIKNKNFMKKYCIYILGISIAVSLLSCGPTAAEKAKIEQERADSIAAVEARELEIKRAQEEQDSIKRAENRKVQWEKDSVQIMELLPSFSTIKDKELESKRIYVAKGITTSHYNNSAYLSFTTVAGKAEDLFLNVDIVGSSSILIEYASVIIGDDFINVQPSKEVGHDVERYPKIGEWMEGIVSANLMEKISECESLKVKAIGSDGEKLINISPTDLEKMKMTIRLYQLFRNSKVIEI